MHHDAAGYMPCCRWLHAPCCHWLHALLATRHVLTGRPADVLFEPQRQMAASRARVLSRQASQIWPPLPPCCGRRAALRRRRPSAARVAVRSGGQRCTKLRKPHQSHQFTPCQHLHGFLQPSPPRPPSSHTQPCLPPPPCRFAAPPVSLQRAGRVRVAACSRTAAPPRLSPPLTRLPHRIRPLQCAPRSSCRRATRPPPCCAPRPTR